MRVRAKAKSSSTPHPIWVQGEYITQPPIRPADGAHRPAGHYIDKGGYPGANVYEVSIETLCMDTGAVDCQKSGIFENDILLYETEQEIGYFIIQDKDTAVDIINGEILGARELQAEDIKVIGSMIDFPDFVEGIRYCIDGIGESGQKNKYRGGLAIPQDYKPYEGKDKEAPGPEYFKELFRISRNQIIFGANHFISRIPIDSSCWIVWDKQNEHTDFADCELAWTSFDTAVKKFSFRWNGMLQGDMKNKETRIHPNQKPARLYEMIIRRYANIGDKIIDTHAGSGSCLIAAHRTGHDFIGFEIDPYYCGLAEERLETEKKLTSIKDRIKQRMRKGEVQA